MRHILDAESRAIAAIPVSDAYDRAVALIIERVHRLGGKLVASGMGKAGQIAQNIASTFSSTGTRLSICIRVKPSTATLACCNPTMLCSWCPIRARHAKLSIW